MVVEVVVRVMVAANPAPGWRGEAHPLMDIHALVLQQQTQGRILARALVGVMVVSVRARVPAAMATVSLWRTRRWSERAWPGPGSSCPS
eukprot:scaffold29840_cov14-Tisochrysis_lutea.AAC.1